MELTGLQIRNMQILEDLQKTIKEFELKRIETDLLNIDKIQQAGISNTQQYKMAGNSICIPVLEAIFKELFL